MVVGAQGGRAGDSNSRPPGTPAPGDGEPCPGGGPCSRRACGGQQFPTARAYQPWGTGSPILAVVGAHGGLAADNNSQRPRHTGPGGRGVLRRWWSALKEGLRGAAAPYGPGTPAWGDGEPCPGGGRCSRRACGGQQFPLALAYQPGGTWSTAQVVVGAQGGPAGGLFGTSACTVFLSLSCRGVVSWHGGSPKRGPMCYPSR